MNIGVRKVSQLSYDTVSLIKPKKLYFSGQFIKQRGNGRKTWQTIDNALHRKSNKTSPNAV